MFLTDTFRTYDPYKSGIESGNSNPIADTRVGNPIAVDTVDAVWKINPFYTIRPMSWMQVCERLPLNGARRCFSFLIALCFYWVGMIDQLSV